MDWTVLFGGAVTVLIGAMGSVAYVVGSKSKGDYNQLEITEMKSNIDSLYNKTNDNKSDMVRMKTLINGMRDDITEIKADVKEILRGS